MCPAQFVMGRIVNRSGGCCFVPLHLDRSLHGLLLEPRDADAVEGRLTLVWVARRGETGLRAAMSSVLWPWGL